MSLQTLVVGSVAWLALCAAAIWWVLPRLAYSDKELDHEEAILMDREWNAQGYPVGLPPYYDTKLNGGAILQRPVPPILDQSSAWRDRARRAEALGFMDDDSPTAA